MTIALRETILYFLQHSNHIELGEPGYVNLSFKAGGHADPEQVGLKHIKQPALHRGSVRSLKQG